MLVYNLPHDFVGRHIRKCGFMSAPLNGYGVWQSDLMFAVLLLYFWILEKKKKKDRVGESRGFPVNPFSFYFLSYIATIHKHNNVDVVVGYDESNKEKCFKYSFYLLHIVYFS